MVAHWQKEEKARQNAANFCERLGKYHMPFAWTAIYLKNIVEGGNPLDTDKEKSDSLGQYTILCYCHLEMHHW